MVQISQSRSVWILLGPNWSSRLVMALLGPNWSGTVRFDLFGSKNLKNTPFAKDFDMNRFFCRIFVRRSKVLLFLYDGRSPTHTFKILEKSHKKVYSFRNPWQNLNSLIRYRGFMRNPFLKKWFPQKPSIMLSVRCSETSHFLLETNLRFEKK